MNIEDDELQDLFKSIMQDIQKEAKGSYAKTIKSKINKLRKRIDKRYEIISEIDEKIKKCENVMEIINEKALDPHYKIIVENWKNYLEEKRERKDPSDLVSEKGRLKGKLSSLKVLQNSVEKI